MPQISVRLPDDVVDSLDRAANTLKRSRADVVRQAIERYLEDYDDLQDALMRMQDPADPMLDWEDAKRELLGKD